MMEFLKELGIREVNPGATLGTSDGWIETTGPELVSISPIDGRPIARIRQATAAEYEKVAKESAEAFRRWRMVPGPQRGQIVKEIGEVLVRHKEALGRLVTLEMGKIFSEGQGEVQEMIDVADFAVGLSRQLYGLTMPSERPDHRICELWHPLGPVGVVTSFNFPVAVWSWNALLAAVCGDTVIWKPSSQTPLCAIAVQNLIAPVVDRHGLRGVFSLVIGPGREVGDALVRDSRVPLVSFTGSTAMGRRVGAAVAERFGRSILELGGNNAMIVAPDADLNLAAQAVVFGALGTAGQRCTSTRRVLVHESVKEALLERLEGAYRAAIIGNPLDPQTTVGPLVDDDAVADMMHSLEEAVQKGGKVLLGGRKLAVAGLEGGCYVLPAIVEAPPDLPIMQEETFAPLLYVVTWKDLDEALALHNNVRQGLSSSIFTDSFQTAGRFLSAEGSDCGIANVNVGTNGAEIGGAFGGEKETGGGRESGSDSWKAYMRRQTVTVNWGRTLRLAQGIDFSV